MIYNRFEAQFDDMAIHKSFAVMLYGLVVGMRPKTVVETGTHAGYSTLHLAQALQDNDYGHLTTYDLKDYGAETALKNFGLSEFVTVKLEDSRKVVEKDIDFAFVDSEHSEEFVTQEWENLKARLSPHAVVVWENASVGNQNKWPSFGVRKILELEKCVYLPAPNGAIIYYHGGIEGPGGLQMR